MRTEKGRSHCVVKYTAHLLFALAFCMAPLARAQHSLPLRQFDHQAWGRREGAPADVNALAQTTDGFLWLGTANGLFRFDGVHFERFVPPPGELLLNPSIDSLLAAPDGGLWIGYTIGDTSFLHGGHLQTFRQPRSEGAGTISSLALDHDGSVWAVTSVGAEHFYEHQWHVAGVNEGLPRETVSVFVDETGGVWFATPDYIYRRPHGAHLFQRTGVLAGADAVFEQGPHGTIWICTPHGIEVLDEQNAQDTKWRSATNVPHLREAHFDVHGGLWITSRSNGIYRIERPQPGGAKASTASAEHFRAQDGLTTERMGPTLIDREGSIWMASPDGLRRFRAMALQPANLPLYFTFYPIAAASDGSLYVGSSDNGLQRSKDGVATRVKAVKADRVTCVYAGRDGKIWVGAGKQLGYLERGRFVEIPLPAPALHDTQHDIEAMTTDADSNLILQDVSLSPILRFDGKHWTPIRPTSGTVDTPNILMTDQAGRLWAGYMNGSLAVYGKVKTLELSPTDGVTVGNVLALYEAPEGVWVGGEHGLDLFVRDHPTQVKFEGEQITGVSGIVRLHDGSLWLNSLNGLVRIAPEELERFRRHPDHAMRYTAYTELDGLAGEAQQMGGYPTLVQAADGRLWVEATRGVSSLDPSAIVKNGTAPPVTITLVKAGEQTFDPAGALKLPESVRDVEIDYTALSLAMPERVKFKYRLDGFDREWQNAGTRRAAFYTHLPPGNYTFHVIACNEDGVWNEAGAVTQFLLQPSFYQTRWFKLLIVAICAGAILLLVFLRMQFVAFQIQERWAVRLHERERIARELHDTFLQGVQGILLRVKTATRRVDPASPAHAELEDALRQSAEVLATGRSLVQTIRSTIQPRTLLSDLETAGRELQALYGTQFSAYAVGHARDLNVHVEEELCKIGREALSNSFRHARASTIRVELRFERRSLTLSVHDDGVGIEEGVLTAGARPGHWGLPGIRERVKSIKGIFRLESAPAQGTTLEVIVSARAAYRRSAFKLPMWIGNSWRENSDASINSHIRHDRG